LLKLYLQRTKYVVYDDDGEDDNNNKIQSNFVKSEIAFLFHSPGGILKLTV